jgi:hypothetical protein
MRPHRTGLPIFSVGALAAAVVSIACPRVAAQGVECVTPPPPTFTVTLPKLGLPPDDEGQGWSRPAVWAGHPDASDDAIEVPNGRPIYAIFVSGYARNAPLDELTFYNFARHLQARGAYVHFAWWNNLLAPYMERPLHSSQSHPGTNADLLNFTTPAEAADKAVPGEDYQFVADATLLLRAIRQHNPSAMIIVAGHSMGGGAVIHLGDHADVVIDILAPIDPVGNRNYPWAGLVLYQNAHHFNWTRWRATRDNFLGYRDRLLVDFCDPSGPWLANIADATSSCPAGIAIHGAAPVRFGSNIINLHHRWQNEARFPFDFQDNYSFDHSRPPGGTTSQSAIPTCDVGADPGGWPFANSGDFCCPQGAGICWGGDGHGEIVGFRGPLPPRPLGVVVRSSPQCGECTTLNWPTRTLSGGTWNNGNSSLRRQLMEDLESLPINQTWAHAPTSPGLCLVSQGLINRFNSMNKPPLADAGPDQDLSCDPCDATPVTLDASASSDPDEDTLEYRWTWAFGSASGRTPTINLPAGVHCITLEVEDLSGHIARDTVAVAITNPGVEVVSYASAADAWRKAVGTHEGYAFDQFFPGRPDALGCLLQQPFEPATLALAGGTLRVTAHEKNDPSCAITDASTPPAVADAHIANESAVVELDFDPPVSAFYTYFGSLQVGETATLHLYDSGSFLVQSITSPPSTHSSRAAGLGFISSAPIARIVCSTTEAGSVLVGAFVGLRTNEQSLGTVDLGDYDGPGGSGIIELDFACTFADTRCRADFSGDGTVNSQDFFDFLVAFFAQDPRADFNADSTINSQDFFDFLGAFFNGC